MTARKLKLGAVRLLGPLGGYALTRAAYKHSPRIFMYHRFSPNPAYRKLHAAAFEAQVAELRRSCRVMTLGELAAYLERGAAVPAHTAVITVDDGYRDFLEVAAPILQRHGVPATLFVTTKFVDGNFWLWPDRLEHGLATTAERELHLDGRGRWPLGTESERRAAWQALVDIATSVADADRRALIDEVLERLAVELPAQPPAEYAGLSWAELRELRSMGIEIGAHTLSHPVLSRIPAAELDTEIGGSKQRIEEQLNGPVVSFCYPNGMPQDISASVKAAVVRAGFKAAVAAYFDTKVLDDRLEIRRYGGGDDAFQFRRNLYGVEYLSAVLKGRRGTSRQAQ